MSEASFKLVWEYDPNDFFEEAFEFQFECFQIGVDAGKVNVSGKKIAGEFEELLDSLQSALDARFRAQQLSNHRPFELSLKSEIHVAPDGRVAHVVRPPLLTASLTLHPPDFSIVGPDGKITDTRRERITRDQRRSDLVASFALGDPTASAILRSYSAAVSDPKNELVHLFEIVEALRLRFGGQKEATKALATDWSSLSWLANDAPLNQGRHRGRNVAQLRDATREEISTARREAVSAIDAYLTYLARCDGTSTPSTVTE